MNELFVDIVVTAIEHFGYGSIEYPDVQQDDDQPYSVAVGEALLAGAELDVQDVYGDGTTGTLTYDKIIAAISQRTFGVTVTRNIDQLLELFGENFDVIDADAVMQQAAFGSVVYG